jgi:ribonuclease HII
MTESRLMYLYENQFALQGYKLIAGLDEAGRGPIAGPVVAACVILHPDDEIIGLNDSKQLSEQKRNELEIQIKQRAICYQVAFVDEATIDRINIYQASKMAMLDALKKMAIQPDALLTDAMPLKEANIPYLPLIHGDALSASIAAASILAKVERDRYMLHMDELYPGYGFSKHKGYYTLEHKLALLTHGATPIHRKTFAPVQQILYPANTLF